MASYGRQNDEQLAALAKSGDISALEQLIARYARAFRANGAALSALGLEPDDISQETMIAVINAVRSYSSSKSASFKTYVTACINNRVRSLLRSQSGKRHRPLNESVSFDELSESGGAVTPQLSLKFSEDPEALVIKQEYDQHIWQQIVSVLSDLERAVFTAYLRGYTYEEIARQFGLSVKSVDNALQRSKLKLKSIEF